MSLTLVSSRRKVVIGLCATFEGCSTRGIVSEVPLMYGIVAVVVGPELTVGVSVGISVTVSVPSNKVRVVVVFTENIVQVFINHVL